MPWFKVDDKHHDHRKTRKALRGVPGKRRDAAAMGLWELAGSWCADNLTDGFVPTDELYRWDDDAETLAGRLVDADYWAVDEVDGEAGFRFVNWPEHQPMKETVEQKREAARDRMRAVRATPKKGAKRVRANSASTAREVRSTPSRPVPSRPAAAAASARGPQPLTDDVPIAILASKLRRFNGLANLRTDKLDADQSARIVELIGVHGDQKLVDAAVRTLRTDDPPQTIQAFLAGWESMPRPGAPALSVVTCSERGHTDPAGACRQCASEALATPKENR